MRDGNEGRRLVTSVAERERPARQWTSTCPPACPLYRSLQLRFALLRANVCRLREDRSKIGGDGFRALLPCSIDECTYGFKPGRKIFFLIISNLYQSEITSLSCAVSKL